jgi:hypothetical protein
VSAEAETGYMVRASVRARADRQAGRQADGRVGGGMNRNVWAGWWAESASRDGGSEHVCGIHLATRLPDRRCINKCALQQLTTAVQGNRMRFVQVCASAERWVCSQEGQLVSG